MYKKSEQFDADLQQIAEVARIFSHPARLAILRYLAKTQTCISGDISNEMPLSRTTISQHLQELKRAGFIHGEIDGVKVNYCLCGETLEKIKPMFENFFNEIGYSCKC